MTNKAPKAAPGTPRSLSSKDQLLLCKLTGFQVEDNLAIKKGLADKKRNTIGLDGMQIKSFPQEPTRNR